MVHFIVTKFAPFFNACFNSFDIYSSFSDGKIILFITNYFLSHKFTCCFSCFMSYFLWKQLSEHLFMYPIIAFHICLTNFMKMVKFHVFCHIFSLLILENNVLLMCYFYLLISNIKLNLPSISNSLPFWSVNVMIISSKCYYTFSKTLNWFNI